MWCELDFMDDTLLINYVLDLLGCAGLVLMTISTTTLFNKYCNN